MAEDVWTTETGFLDDFDFTIEKATFATDMAYNNGETLLMIWEGKTDDPDTPEHRVMFPCGTGWSSVDGGKTAVHEKGKKRFITTSIYGRVIDRCVKELNMGDILKKRGAPTEAKVWVGLKFHMKTEKLEFGSGLEARERLMPIEFLGEVDIGPSKQRSLDEAKGQDQSPDKDKERKILRAKLIALAKKAESHNDFMNQAMAIDGVADDNELLAEIIDENGLYKEAHG